MRSLAIACLVLAAFAAGWLLRGLSLEAPQPPAQVETAPAATVAESAAGVPAELLELESALAADDFDTAVALYAAVEDPGRAPELAARMRAVILERARAASGRRELEAALELLQGFTFYYHRDTPALYLLADAAERLGRSEVALAALLDALTVELTGPDPEPARARVASLVDALAAGRLQLDDTSGVIGLYRRVLEHDPLNHRYRYLLAGQLEARGEYREARDVLGQIPAGEFDDAARAGLQQRIDESTALAERFSEGVPLERFGDHFLVDVTTDDGRVLRLLLDTGASRSVLKPGTVARISHSERLPRGVRVGTASGVIDAARYRLPGLTLGPFHIEAPVIVVLELEALSGVDGLLGLDLLGRFDYRIDPLARRLLLARAE